MGGPLLPRSRKEAILSRKGVILSAAKDLTMACRARFFAALRMTALLRTAEKSGPASA
jgi:hypothetical protein